jgi:hypothetical protein
LEQELLPSSGATDSAATMPTQDWARVVAVFVQGANWQFSDFPFKVCQLARASLNASMMTPVFAHA